MRRRIADTHASQDLKKDSNLWQVEKGGKFADQVIKSSFGNAQWQAAHGGKENFQNFQESKGRRTDGSEASQYSWKDKHGTNHNAMSTSDGRIQMQTTGKDGKTSTSMIDPSTGKVEGQSGKSGSEKEIGLTRDMQQGIASATAQVKQSAGSGGQIAEKALQASFGSQKWQEAHGGKENFKDFKEDKVARQDGSQASQYSWTDKEGVKHSATSTEDGKIQMQSTGKDGLTSTSKIDPTTGRVPDNPKLKARNYPETCNRASLLPRHR